MESVGMGGKEKEGRDSGESRSVRRGLRLEVWKWKSGEEMSREWIDQ
jgi:hypothetical protein